MASNISFNPYLTTSAMGTFSIQSDGLEQGVALDDPTVRNLLDGGALANTETLPMWGGVGIYENIAPLTGAQLRTIGRASSLANLTGFSVVNQASNWVTSPQSECPSAGAGMTVPFYRFGSNARITVQIDPALITLAGGLVTQQVSWDFAMQRLIPFFAAEAQIAITSLTWSPTNGGQVAVVTAAPTTLMVGSDFTIAGVTPAAYNGTWTVNTWTDSMHFTFLMPAMVSPGAVTVPGYILAGGGALPVKILSFNQGYSKVVSYDAVNNLVHWNNSGSAAVILI